MDEPSGQFQSSAAAQRRRLRRMRSWWRHEQQSVRLALATATHHSSGKVHTANDAPRGHTTATKTGEEGRGEAATATGALPPLQAFFQLYDEEDGGVRGLSAWQSRRGRRERSSSTVGSRSLRPWSLSRCSAVSTLLCRRWWTSWWVSCGSSSPLVLSR